MVAAIRLQVRGQESADRGGVQMMVLSDPAAMLPPNPDADAISDKTVPLY